jgi:hypothetical protein
MQTTTKTHTIELEYQHCEKLLTSSAGLSCMLNMIGTMPLQGAPADLPQLLKAAAVSITIRIMPLMAELKSMKVPAPHAPAHQKPRPGAIILITLPADVLSDIGSSLTAAAQSYDDMAQLIPAGLTGRAQFMQMRKDAGEVAGYFLSACAADGLSC